MYRDRFCLNTRARTMYRLPPMTQSSVGDRAGEASGRLQEGSRGGHGCTRPGGGGAGGAHSGEAEHFPPQRRSRAGGAKGGAGGGVLCAREALQVPPRGEPTFVQQRKKCTSSLAVKRRAVGPSLAARAATGLWRTTHYLTGVFRSMPLRLTCAFDPQRHGTSLLFAVQ
eukprot:1187034-Prorocentrum_minimum.AAC.1